MYIIYQVVYAFQISLGSIGMVHRDIKPENILFNSLPNGLWEFKICDLGTAKILS